MRPSPLVLAVLCSLYLFWSDSAAAAPPGFRALEIGDPAPDFRLPGVDDRDHALADFADAKLLLVIFTCNHCPTAQAYEARILKLYADYKDRGVALVAISPNDDKALRLDELGYTDVGDSFEDMKLRAKEQGFKFPYLYDGETQKVSAAYGVVATPQVFLFDAARKLRYVGRIDDSDVRTVTSHDTRNAIDALLAGKPVPVEKTRTFGCSTKWSEKRSEAQASLDKWNKEPVMLKPLDEAALAKLVKNETENVVLINVWATWCAPCIAELPEFVTIHRMYRHRNLQLVTISMDEPDQGAAALKVLEKQSVAATNYHLSIADRDRFADLLDKEWDGPLPHTVLIAPGGEILYRKNGEMDPLELKRAIVNKLGRTYASRVKKD
jgi:peroxiredoxin